MAFSLIIASFKFTDFHPSIIFCSSEAGSRGQQPEQGHPDFPVGSSPPVDPAHHQVNHVSVVVHLDRAVNTGNIVVLTSKVLQVS